MTIVALALVTLFATQDPTELDKLKLEVERLRRHNTDLQRQLDSTNQLLLKRDQVQPPAPRTAEQLYLEAEQLFLKREYEKAYEEVVKALKTDPKMGSARSLLEQIQAAQRDLLDVKKADMARKGKIYGAAFTEIVARVTATANEVGLVVLSAGSQLDILEGDEFTITRKGEVIGKVKVDRVDTQWCAGKMIQKTKDPMVGDDAIRKDPRNASAPPPLKRATADEVQSLRKELDDVRSQVRELTDKLLPAYQGAGVSVEEAPELLRAHLGISRGLVVRRVREGSPAERAGLKVNDVVPDLQESQLVEAVESGKPINLIRQGQRTKGR